jgi:hypothetical protein
MMLSLCVAIWATLHFDSAAFVVNERQQPPDKPTGVLFFDITDLPARIDEPKLRKDGDGYLLNCAVANRSSDQLFGLRLILMIVEPGGKLRSRITWNEASQVAPYSIKTFEFRPRIKGKIQSDDNLFLAVDEVTGKETIWHAAEAEKALRAFSRGQHDVMPKVRTVSNKVDPPDKPRLIPREQE